MAELFQTEFNEIKNRRGAQDLDNLIALLDDEGSISIADDPSEDEIRAAREQAAKDAEKQQAEAQKEAEKQQAEAEKQAEEEKAAKPDDTTARAAALPLAEDNIPAMQVEASDETVTDAGENEPKAQKKTTGR